MIIGHGDVASILTDRDDRTYFAAGVSNSQETRESEYKRERDLLMDQDISKHLIYFGSLAVFYSSTRYSQHKMEMENLVKRIFRDRYTIIRMGNITWGTNPHTLINFLRNRIRNGEPCEIRNEYRYVVEPMEFLHWINLIPPWSCEMNVVGRRMKVMEIVREYCMPKGTVWHGKSVSYNSLSVL